MADENAVASDARIPGKSRRKLIVLAALVVVVGVGGFFAMRLLSTPASATPVPEATPEPGEILAIGEMTTTLPGTPPRFARVNLSLQLGAEAVAADMEPDLPLFKDATVSELALSDAQVLMTAEGVDDLRARLLERAQEIYPDDQVLRVLVTELVLQ